MADGTRVPSVTTVIGRYKDSGALIGWAHKQGLAGVPLHEARDRAADIGSAVHAALEVELSGGDPRAALLAYTPHTHEGPDADFLRKCERAYSAFRKWWEQSRLEVLATEVPLVSERWAVGGTLDAILREPDGALALGDWKTSKGVYLDHPVQLAAYARIWEETRGDHIASAHLMRFSKAGTFEHRWFPDLEPAWAYFRHLLAAYKAEGAVKEML